MRNKKLIPIIKKLAHENNLTESEIHEIVNSPYQFTSDTIDELKMKDVTEEEFKKLKTNFIYKYIGKLYTNYDAIKHKRTRQKNINKLNTK
jgi:tRNA A37 threonylcarbamoyladenosine dehydratase